MPDSKDALRNAARPAWAGQQPFLFLILIWMLSGMTLASPQQWLVPHAWEHRHVLVFSPQSEDKRLDHLKRAWRHLSQEVADRNLLLWEILGPEQVLRDGVPLEADPVVWREAYKVTNDDFTVILLGYDGGEKLRQQEVDLRQVMDEIDLMPIRRMEMNR